VADALILVVEDNERNRRLVCDVLTHAGYRVLTAESAEEGLPLAAREHPDLILMDVQLPGMDGVAALAALRAERATAGVPVLAVTAFAMKDDRERFLAAGFDGYLEKPIDVRALPRQVEDVLRSRATGAPA